jgi:hypothetical protein
MPTEEKLYICNELQCVKMNMLRCHKECGRQRGGGHFCASAVTAVRFYDSLGYGVVDCAAAPVTHGKI